MRFHYSIISLLTATSLFVSQHFVVSYSLGNNNNVGSNNLPSSHNTASSGPQKKNYSPTGGDWLIKHDPPPQTTTGSSSNHYLDHIAGNGQQDINSEDHHHQYDDTRLTSEESSAHTAGIPSPPDANIKTTTYMSSPANMLQVQEHSTTATTDMNNYATSSYVANFDTKEQIQISAGVSSSSHFSSTGIPSQTASSSSANTPTKFAVKSKYIYAPRKTYTLRHQLSSYVDNLGSPSAAFSNGDTPPESSVGAYVDNLISSSSPPAAAGINNGQLIEPVDTPEYDAALDDMMSHFNSFYTSSSDSISDETPPAAEMTIPLVESASNDSTNNEPPSKKRVSKSPMFEYLKFDGAPTFDVLERTKSYVDSIQFGTMVETKEEIYDKDYVLRGTVIGPINRADLHQTQQELGLQYAFPNVEIDSFGFTIDPENPYRCFYFQRWRAIHEHNLKVHDDVYPSTGAEIETPISLSSIVWTPSGKIIYEQVGAVVDRLEGNTQGKPAELGLMHAAGMKVDAIPGDKVVAFRQRFDHFVGGRGRSWSKPKDIPEWWTSKSRGADESDQ